MMRVVFTVPSGAIVTSIFTVPAEVQLHREFWHDGLHEAFGRPFVFDLTRLGASLAHLMLARASARAREMALRITVGASRGLPIQQILAESNRPGWGRGACADAEQRVGNSRCGA